MNHILQLLIITKICLSKLYSITTNNDINNNNNNNNNNYNNNNNVFDFSSLESWFVKYVEF